MLNVKVQLEMRRRRLARAKRDEILNYLDEEGEEALNSRV
jgi:hypothetical protein